VAASATGRNSAHVCETVRTIRLLASVCIDAPAERVWARLSRLEDIRLWSEAVLDAHCDGALSQGVGAERTCDLRGGITIRERWLAWNEGRSFAYEGVGVPFVARAERMDRAAGGRSDAPGQPSRDRALKLARSEGCSSRSRRGSCAPNRPPDTSRVQIPRGASEASSSEACEVASSGNSLRSTPERRPEAACPRSGQSPSRPSSVDDAKAVAGGCAALPKRAHGKKGVDGSSLPGGLP
jgi:hypothetical protein